MTLYVSPPWDLSSIYSADPPSSAQYISPRPGPIIDQETGLQVGEHAGPWNFTIGQGAKVKGLKEKTFVAKKDIPKNIIYVVPGTSVSLHLCSSFSLAMTFSDHKALYAQTLTVYDWTWIWTDKPPIEITHPGGFEARIKFRHVMSDVGCIVYW